MVNERTLELIHAQIDGEIDAADHADLLRQLDADPEAGELNEQLARISGALGRMPKVSPRSDLHQRVMQATGPKARVIPFRGRHAQVIGYGLAMAAGVAFAVIGLSVVQTNAPSFDPGGLVATMGLQVANPATAVTTRRIAGPELVGSVALSPAAGGWLLLFDLQSGQPVAVKVTYDAAVFRLNGYAQAESRADAAITSFNATPGQVGFVNQGSQRLALFLTPGAGGPVRIHYETAGNRLGEEVIDVPATGRLH